MEFDQLRRYFWRDIRWSARRFRRRLRLAGQTVIEFWADEVFLNPALVLAELRRHLAI